ncbi:hypothetical protein [Candidatus Palauibacter sp.]|uniref:hypothetical protein n=1 Tax=Candidatus Palauibacter sp. TaxID=3101350 RepID=UPI003B020925
MVEALDAAASTLRRSRAHVVRHALERYLDIWKISTTWRSPRSGCAIPAIPCSTGMTSRLACFIRRRSRRSVATPFRLAAPSHISDTDRY